MAKFDIKTVKPKFVVTTSPENKIDVVVNKPIIETKLSKSFFKLKNTGGPRGPKGDTGAAGADGDAATIQVGQVETLQPNQQAYVQNVGSTSQAIFNIGIPKGEKGDSGSGSGDMTAATYDPNGTVAAAGGIPDYVDSNGGKIDTIEVNGTPQTITNKTVDISVPTKTSDLTNDGSDNTSTYVEADELATVATSGAYSDLSGTPNLATVATSGSYNDLSNKPTIPTVNDATLTIQHNGTNVQTFTANQGTNATANIETIWADDIESTTPVPAVETAMIADGAVTSDKIDWTSVVSERFSANYTGADYTKDWGGGIQITTVGKIAVATIDMGWNANQSIGGWTSKTLGSLPSGYTVPYGFNATCYAKDASNNIKQLRMSIDASGNFTLTNSIASQNFAYVGGEIVFVLN